MYQNQILFVTENTSFNLANTAEASGDPGTLSQNSRMQWGILLRIITNRKTGVTPPRLGSIRMQGEAF